MSTHNIPFSIQTKKIRISYPKSAAKEVFPRDSRTSSKQPWLRAISVRATEVYCAHICNTIFLVFLFVV